MSKNIAPYNDKFQPYQSNGTLNFKGNFVNGKRHGLWEQYYANGNLYSKGNYNNGKGIGLWKFCDYCNSEVNIKIYYI